MQRISKNLVVWGSDIEPGTINQAMKAAGLPILAGPVALMPDAHVGIGATVGSVIATDGAIIPSAVGVDIGCGMIASRMPFMDSQLPDDLTKLLPVIEQAVPAGVGKGHGEVSKIAEKFMRSTSSRLATELDTKLNARALDQFGSLGSGNHFFEICLDEAYRVWIVLHSGSRGIGNQLATQHISKARSLAKNLELRLEDQDLAWFVEGTEEFKAYITDMLWAQDYAMENRQTMLTNVVAALAKATGLPWDKPTQVVNCHHNFAQLERHGDRNVWITRKGAIQANVGMLGVIPGSMGTRSYIVEGKGVAESWCSCSHGAGRRYSRGEAKRRFTVDDLANEMEGKTWLSDRAEALLDEIPSAYKDVDQVMADQADLVRPLHTLRQILNYKGT